MGNSISKGATTTLSDDLFAEASFASKDGRVICTGSRCPATSTDFVIGAGTTCESLSPSNFRKLPVAGLIRPSPSIQWGICGVILTSTSLKHRVLRKGHWLQSNDIKHFQINHSFPARILALICFVLKNLGKIISGGGG